MPSLVPRVPIDLDRRRYLHFNNWARCQAEREISTFWGKDISIYDVLTRMPIRANDLAIIVWQALIADDPSLSLADTMDAMDYATLPDIMDAVLKAWNISTPADAAPADANGTTDPFGLQTTASTGSSSGPTAVLS
jgi:hypothetical protein